MKIAPDFASALKERVTWRVTCATIGQMKNTVLIEAVEVMSPRGAARHKAGLGIVDGRFEAIGAAALVIDGSGLVALPGLIDPHVHFRTPGNEDAETLASGARAAAAGGVAAVLVMPNTIPALDNPDRVRDQLRRAAGLDVNVLVSAAITEGRQGRALTDARALADAGARALTDDGSTPDDPALLRDALYAARDAGLPVLDHALDRRLSTGGVMHLGERSRDLGFAGIPSKAEALTVERDLLLAKETGCHVHIQHISARETVRLLADAKREGIRATSEVCPHHLALSDADIPSDDAAYKMAPPLRSPADRAALIDGLCDGTIDMLATDHAPHTRTRKAEGFLRAPFGVIGLETAAAVTYETLVASGRVSIEFWLDLWTVGAAELLKLPLPRIAPGLPAHFSLFDTSADWVVAEDDFAGKSRNSPFIGRRYSARPVATFFAGRLVWNAPSFARRLRQ